MRDTFKNLCKMPHVPKRKVTSIWVYSLFNFFDVRSLIIKACWQNGYATDCKSVYLGSTPWRASICDIILASRAKFYQNWGYEFEPYVLLFLADNRYKTVNIILKWCNTNAGWSSLVARRAHNPKVVGSNPAPATIFYYSVNAG